MIRRTRKAPTNTSSTRQPGRRRWAARVAAILTVAATILGAAGIQFAAANPIIDFMSDPITTLQCAVTGDPGATGHHADTPPLLFLHSAATTLPATQLPKDTQWDTMNAKPKAGFTLWEVFYDRGVQWSYTSYYKQSGFAENKVFGDAARVCNTIDAYMTQIANGLLGVAKMLVYATITVRHVATTPIVPEMLMDSLSGPMTNIFNGLFVALATTMVILTGLWLMSTSVGGKDNRRAMLSALTWPLIAMFVGSVLMAPWGGDGPANAPRPNQPGYVRLSVLALRGANEMSTYVGELLMAGVAGNDQCSLPSTASYRGWRSGDCIIYNALIVQPWAVGQFGSLDWSKGDLGKNNGKGSLHANTGADLRFVQINSQALTNAELLGIGTVRERSPLGMFGAWSNEDMSTNTTYGQWNNLRQYLWEHGDEVGVSYPVWAGTNQGLNRINQAASSILGTALTTAFLLWTTLLAAIWAIVLVVLFVSLPIVAVISIFPPAQKLARGWAQSFVKAIIMVFAYQTVQMVALALSSVVWSIPWLDFRLKWVLMIVMLFALRKAFKSVREDALTPNFGGDKTGGVDTDKAKQGAQQAGKTAVQVGASAIPGIGPLAGAAVGGTAAGLLRRGGGGQKPKEPDLSPQEKFQTDVDAAVRKKAVDQAASNQIAASKEAEAEQRKQDAERLKLGRQRRADRWGVSSPDGYGNTPMTQPVQNVTVSGTRVQMVSPQTGRHYEADLATAEVAEKIAKNLREKGTATINDGAGRIKIGHDQYALTTLSTWEDWERTGHRPDGSTPTPAAGPRPPAPPVPGPRHSRPPQP